jgi:hypothetical protein
VAFRSTSATPASAPQRNWVLCDGSIELSGGATIAVSSQNSYLYMRNVYVKATTIARNVSSSTTLAGDAANWKRVREYAFAPNGVIVDGSTPTGNGVSNLGLEDAPSGPPDGLAAIHGWDPAEVPSYHGAIENGGVIDIRDHGAVQADTDAVSGTDCSTAINAAFAAGVSANKPVFIPRGFWYVRGTLTIPLGCKVIGSSISNSVIHSSRHWAPVSATDLVRTEDGDGDVFMSDFCINGHEPAANQNLTSHRFIRVLHIRCSNVLARNVHTNRREWFRTLQLLEPGIKFSGNAGGRVFNSGLFFHGDTDSVDASHRTMLIDGTTNPLALYNPDWEGTNNTSGPQGEIVDSENVTFYGLKHEPGVTLLQITDSDNICILGGSGNYTLSSGAFYDITNTPNMVVAVIARQGADMAVPFVREDGVTRTPGAAKIAGLVKRGDPIPFGELIGAAATTPQTLTTGTTASVSAGNILLYTAVGMRNPTDSDISDLAWALPVENAFLINGGSAGRSLGTGFGQDQTGGTYASTAGWENSNGDAPAIAAILAFTVTDA